ncbi:MAG: OmpA family protein [Deltaproteobacteria bacterium]|nr:OmpA family protein [Deltaproteobacteria bacterium]
MNGVREVRDVREVREVRRSRPLHRSAALPLVLSVLLFSPAARAQLSGSVDAEAFRPAPGPMDGFVVQRSTPEPHLAWAVRLIIDYAHEPLVLRRDGEIVERIIEHRLGAHLLGSVGFLDILEVGVGLPFVLVQTGETSLSLGDLSAAAVGDLQLDLKAAWPERFGGMFGVAVGATVRFGTGDAESFSGEGAAGFDPRLILDLQTDWFGLALDFGYRLRENASIASFPVADELTYALGVVVPVADLAGWDIGGLDAIGEVWGATPAADPFVSRNRSPLEALGGVRWRHPGGLIVSAGAGGGLTRGYTSPDVRAFLELGYAASPPPPGPPDADGDGIPDDDDRCPLEEEDEDEFQDEDGCPDPDNDGDGVLDDDDDCPLEKEDADGFEDGDGCPDPDNDGDGILDGDDDCPDVAETVNGVQDEDGCPEGDRDGDTIVDDVDRCPEEAEDADGFADEDGCPDPDNDGDGIRDVDDGCRDEPETANGFEDEDGCPDFARRGVAEIAILKPILFRSNSDEILAESYPVLADVASIMEAHPEIRIRVEGHTDDRGSDEHNLELSRDRAAAVVRFLVERHGIGAERLSSEGFGEAQPIGPNATPEGRARNRRVVFTIEP